MKIRQLFTLLVRIETRSVEWKARNGLNILRVALGLVFVWFGVLKFVKGISSAEIIAGKTILKLTFGYVKPAFSLPFLAVWECTIGLGLLFKRWLSLTLLLLYLQMLGTFLPLFFFPHETFNHSVLVPTLLGQYIIKNIVLLSSSVVIGATVKGGELTAKPAPKLNLSVFKNFYNRKHYL
jgi:uncharacterized membrane protein YkgB